MISNAAHRARLLRADEVAARLGVSARRVRLISPAELPFLQLEARGQRKYAEPDVMAYIESRTQRA